MTFFLIFFLRFYGIQMLKLCHSKFWKKFSDIWRNGPYSDIFCGIQSGPKSKKNKYLWSSSYSQYSQPAIHATFHWTTINWTPRRAIHSTFHLIINHFDGPPSTILRGKRLIDLFFTPLVSPTRTTTGFANAVSSGPRVAQATQTRVATLPPATPNTNNWTQTTPLMPPSSSTCSFPRVYVRYLGGLIGSLILCLRFRFVKMKWLENTRVWRR